MTDPTHSRNTPAKASAHTVRDRELIKAALAPLLALVRPTSWGEESVGVWMNSAAHMLGRYSAIEIENVVTDVGLKVRHHQQIVQAVSEAIEADRTRQRERRAHEHPALPSPETAGKDRWPTDILTLEWEGRPWRTGPKSQPATNAMNDQLRHMDSPYRYDRGGQRFICTNWGFDAESRPSNLEETWKPAPLKHGHHGPEDPLTRDELDTLKPNMRSMGLRLGTLTYDHNGILQEAE